MMCCSIIINTYILWSLRRRFTTYPIHQTIPISMYNMENSYEIEITERKMWSEPNLTKTEDFVTHTDGFKKAKKVWSQIFTENPNSVSKYLKEVFQVFTLSGSHV